VSAAWESTVSTEFARLVAEMEMGVPRRQALRNMADRLDVPELSSFVSVIIQSDQLGMSISDTLQAQAKQMRIERRFRAQEAARKVPLKMLFPDDPAYLSGHAGRGLRTFHPADSGSLCTITPK